MTDYGENPGRGGGGGREGKGGKVIFRRGVSFRTKICEFSSKKKKQKSTWEDLSQANF